MSDLEIWTPQICKEYEEWCDEVDLKNSNELVEILRMLDLLDTEDLREGIFTEARVPVDRKGLKIVKN